jgi:hypothetical protein
MKNSKFFNLNLADFGKALIVTVLGAIFARLIPVVDAETLPTLAQWSNAAIVGLAAGLSYLMKNLLTNSSSEVFTKEK